MSKTDISMLQGPGKGQVGSLLVPGGSGFIGLEIVSTDTHSRLQGVSCPGLTGSGLFWRSRQQVRERRRGDYWQEAVAANWRRR